MAEIRVQRKGLGIWPAVIGVLVLVLLVWAALAIWNGEDHPPVDEAARAPAPYAAPTSGTATVPGHVAAFLTFAAAGWPAGPQPGPAHDYTAEGLRRLSAALGAIVDEQQIDDANVRERLEGLRQAAERIQKDPQAAGHAGTVRDAFTQAADLLVAVRQTRWSADTRLQSEVEQVRSAAAAVDTRQPLLEQTDAVRAFFDRAATAVRRLTEQR